MRRRLLLVLQCGASVAGAARDHRGTMCQRCKSGSVVDGGTRTAAGVGCVHWCSRAGYCGDGEQYRRGLDCRGRTDVAPDALARATAEAEAARETRYDADFLKHHGRHTFETYERAADHGHRYGAAISIRGERHCGTGWVRVMTNDNCRERHYWSPKLDADGLYGWKHDFLPGTFDASSKDAVVVVFRNAASWVVKMRKTAYSIAIDRLGGSLARFVSEPFVERGIKFAHVPDLRARKYRQYLEFGRSHANVLGARYEDMVREPTYVFEALRNLGFDCNGAGAFKRVRGYAKFGGAGSGQAYAPPKNHSWDARDWLALVDRLDAAVERALGYAYNAGVPGLWALFPVGPAAGVLAPD
mmetsp:Transcript_7980/g.23792  ORF Transcript_7980/g.23792 Transcript_7980/m.23792 type:complete len:357 (-) Transcript_7980:76-1146(-)